MSQPFTVGGYPNPNQPQMSVGGYPQQAQIQPNQPTVQTGMQQPGFGQPGFGQPMGQPQGGFGQPTTMSTYPQQRPPQNLSQIL